jgi:hypothetical protein
MQGFGIGIEVVKQVARRLQQVNLVGRHQGAERQRIALDERHGGAIG